MDVLHFLLHANLYLPYDVEDTCVYVADESPGAPRGCQGRAGYSMCEVGPPVVFKGSD